MSDTEATDVLLTPPSQPIPQPNTNTTQTKAPPTPKKYSLFVIFAASVAALGGLLFGYDIGIISGALLELKSDFSLTCQNEEMVVSLMLVGALVASLIGGPIIDWIGSRWTIIVNALIFIGGATLLTIANSYAALLCGRLVIGFAVALSAVSECIYIAEISQPHNRGMLVTFNELGIAVGFLLAFSANYLLSEVQYGWRYMFGLSAIPAVIQVVAMLFLPNTPQYLLLHKREEEAAVVVRKLRGLEEDEGNIRQELVHVRLSLAAGRQTSLWTLCSPVDNIRSCVILGAGLVLAQQFTGVPNVLYYAPQIFKQVGFCGNNAALLANLGLGLIKLAATLASLLTVDRLGRRASLLLGCSIIVVSTGVLAGFAIVHQNGAHQPTPCVDHAAGNATVAPHFGLNRTESAECSSAEETSTGWRYLALISVMSYVAAYAFSFGPVTWLLLSEIFPPAIKGRAMAVTSGLNWAANWVVSSTFLRFIDLVTLGGAFIFYTIMGIFALLFIFATIPETKNKPLHKISQELKQSSFKGRFLEHLQALPCLKGNRWFLRISGHYNPLNQSSYMAQDVTAETEII